MTAITISTDNEKDLKDLQEFANAKGWQISYTGDAVHVLKNNTNEKNKNSNV